jgi:hypothetical protein
METILLVLATIATAFILGMGFRIRGGLWGEQIGWGATTARIVAWAIPVALLCWAWYGFVWWIAIAVGVTAWLGTTFGWFGALDMGRMQDTWIRDFLVMTAVGFTRMAVVAPVLWFAGFPVAAMAMCVAGATCGVVYELGWRTPSEIPGFTQGPEVGEFYYGIMVGLAIALAAWVF